ncbi:AI-2E family transporter [Opitutales bacterium ASA1]|uniref:AI-2E family transporter n=1 Tax=Congregicoccus parvus TaxID=3081749 RepID=UPI002B28E2E1|nr:AI-2E family transporter [Opitutales bacterium ASA1]
MADAGSSFFTPGQRRLIGFALGFIALLLIISLLAVVVFVLGRLVGMFAHVLWPLAVAGITALMLRPVVGLLERKARLSRIPSVLVLYLAFVLLVVAVLLLFVPELVRQIVDFVNAVPGLWQRAGTELEEVYPAWVELYNRAMANETLSGMINGAVEQIRSFAMGVLPNLKSAGGTVVGVFGFVANLAIVPVYLFFFLQSDDDPTRSLPEYLPFLKEDTREDVTFLAREFVGIVVAFFRGQLLIGLIMGVLLALGFSLAGLEFGVVFGIFAGLLNIVPYLGTILGLAAVLPTAYFQSDGGLLTVGLCLGVFILVQMIEGYFLTPKIMGDQTGLHPVTIIIAIFFWGTALNGILGMILAIPLTAFLVTAWRLAKRKYLRPV